MISSDLDVNAGEVCNYLLRHLTLFPLTSPYYSYLIECADGSYYCGMTNNIHRRIIEHYYGKTSGNRSIHPERVVAVFRHQTRLEAAHHERELMKMYNRGQLSRTYGGGGESKKWADELRGKKVVRRRWKDHLTRKAMEENRRTKA